MGAPSIPAQPPPPDYAAANKEGLQTAVSLLPLQNQINQAAQLGQKVTYTDPVTGEQKTADFTGMGNAAAAQQAAQILADTNATMQRQQLQLRQELGTANAAQTAKEIQAADPLGYAIRNDIYSKVGGDLNKTFDANAYYDKYPGLKNEVFAGLNDGSTPGTKSVPTADGVKDMTPEQFAQWHYDTYGKAQGLQGSYVGDVKPSSDVAAAADRVGTLAGNTPQNDGRLGGLFNEGATQLDSSAMLGALQNVAANRLGTAGSDPAAVARLNSLYHSANQLPTSFTDANATALNPALQQAVADYQLGGRLNDAQLRNLTDEVRAGQAARGNYLGDAAAVQEALRQTAASNELQQQRLTNLLNVQNQAFGQSDALRNEGQNATLAKLGQLAELQQTGFGQNQSLRQEDRDSAAQQIQTMAGLSQQGFSNEAQRLGALGALAGQDFGQASQAYANQLNGANAGLAAAAAKAADQKSARTEQFGYDQQRLANASSAVLGTPITNQFGSLTAAQQGAVGFTPVNYQTAGQLNPNAGQNAANFASNNFGTLANMWNTSANIASQGSPWMGLLGTTLGAAGGAAGASLGAMI